jgi:hypothetical protein
VTLPKGLADHFRASERLVSAPHGGRDYGSRRELVRDGSVEVRLVAPGPPLVAYLTGLGAAVGEIEPRELRAAVLRGHEQP